jgi:hypothetical protein
MTRATERREGEREERKSLVCPRNKSVLALEKEICTSPVARLVDEDICFSLRPLERRKGACPAARARLSKLAFVVSVSAVPDEPLDES